MNASHPGHSEEERWMQLARKWRSYESEFERGVEAMYEQAAGGDNEGGDTTATTCLLELRNELFQLFVTSVGDENLRRAEELIEQIMAGVGSVEKRGRESNATHDRIDLTRAYCLDSSDSEDGSEDDKRNKRAAVDSGLGIESAGQRVLQPPRRVRERFDAESCEQAERDDNDAGEAVSAWETDSVAS